jgi:hypothetical protein
LERNAELGISLHVFEQNLLAAAIVELCCPAVGVTGDVLAASWEKTGIAEVLLLKLDIEGFNLRCNGSRYLLDA